MIHTDQIDAEVRNLKLRHARHTFPPSQFNYSILVRLIRAQSWCDVSPGVRGRITSGMIELRRDDGREPNPFLLR